MRRLPLLAAAVLLSACAVSSEPEAVGRVSAPVINGVVDTPAKYNSTILIQTELSGGYGAGCTGTLITPHVVVTARHCVSGYDEGTRKFGADYDPAKMYIWYGSEPRGSEDNGVARIVHPSGMYIENNDIALLVLKKAATIDFAQIRLTKPPVKSETVAVAGYGLTTTDTGTPPVSTSATAARTCGSRGRPRHELRPRREGDRARRVDLPGRLRRSGVRAGRVALLAVTSRGGNGERDGLAPYVGWRRHQHVQPLHARRRVHRPHREDGRRGRRGPLGRGRAEAGAADDAVPEPGALGAICAAGASARRRSASSGRAQVCSQPCSDTKPCPGGFACTGGYCIASTEPAPPTEQPPGDEPAPPQAITTTTTTTSS